MEKITSLQNKKVKEWCLLHKKKYRDETHTFLIEGEHLIEEALKEGIVDTILYSETCPFSFEQKIEVTESILEKISDNPSGASYIAICHKLDSEPKEYNRILMLDGIQDPGNLGTLIRTAVSFSFDAIYCSKETVDLYNEKVIRSTQGAFFHIPVIYKDLNEVITSLKEKGVQIVSTALENAENMKDIPVSEKMAFILGNEGQGVSKECIQNSDVCLRIEMNGFESLNVGVAGGIIMYEYRK